MINKKMQDLGENASVIREIFEYSNRRKREIGAERVFDFSIGNPNVPPPTRVKKTMLELLETLPETELHSYTSAPGCAAVRERIASHLHTLFGVETDPSLIYMTCGAAASLIIAMKAMMCRGEQIVVPAPFFPEYRIYAESLGLTLVPVPSEQDFQPSVRAIAEAINEKTGALLLNYPNNPTGAVADAQVLQEIADLLKRRSAEYGHPIYLLSDEPYREFVYDGARTVSIPALYPDTVVCYSYSKSLSLPGERIGYIFIPPALTEARALFHAVCGAGRSLGFVCAPSLMQYTIERCEGTPPDLSSYDRNRRRIYDALTEIGYEIAPPSGAFYLFIRSLEPNANAFAERARAHELLLVPSDSFGCPGYVRLAYCVDHEQIERSIPAFRALYLEYKGDRT